ncbi:MAG: hypothetical protein ACK5JD_12015 [Mangrovibacterium sp.]
MKRTSLVLGLMLLSLFAAIAQTNPGQITVKKSFGSNQFFQAEKRLTINQVVKLMEPTPEAYQLMKSARANNTWAAVFGAAGGFMIGWPLGAAIAGGDPDWVMAGVGAGLVGISIPFASKSTRQSQQAVDGYNESIGSTNYQPKTELNLQVTADGLGLALRF